MRTLRTFSVVVPALLALALASPALALSNRVFLAPSGNNASDCANPLTPCLTFAGAIAQVNPGGEVIAEATGGYGALNITQSVTISGPSGVVIYSGLGVTINAPGATVVLRGLTIDGNGASGHALTVTAVDELHVEGCAIANFTGHGIEFVSPGILFLRDTTVRNMTLAAVQVFPASGTATASVDHCRFEENGYGLGAALNTVMTVRNSVASGNVHSGFEADSGGIMIIESCEASHNGVGMTCNNCWVSNSVVSGNAMGVFGGVSRGNNTVEQNTVNGTFASTYTAK